MKCHRDHVPWREAMECNGRMTGTEDLDLVVVVVEDIEAEPVVVEEGDEVLEDYPIGPTKRGTIIIKDQSRQKQQRERWFTNLNLSGVLFHMRRICLVLIPVILLGLGAALSLQYRRMSATVLVMCLVIWLKLRCPLLLRKMVRHPMAIVMVILVCSIRTVAGMSYPGVPGLPHTDVRIRDLFAPVEGKCPYGSQWVFGMPDAAADRVVFTSKMTVKTGAGTGYSQLDTNWPEDDIYLIVQNFDLVNVTGGPASESCSTNIERCMLNAHIKCVNGKVGLGPKCQMCGSDEYQPNRNNGWYLPCYSIGVVPDWNSRGAGNWPIPLVFEKQGINGSTILANQPVSCGNNFYIRENVGKPTQSRKRRSLSSIFMMLPGGLKMRELDKPVVVLPQSIVDNPIADTNEMWELPNTNLLIEDSVILDGASKDQVSDTDAFCFGRTKTSKGSYCYYVPDFYVQAMYMPVSSDCSSTAILDWSRVVRHGVVENVFKNDPSPIMATNFFQCNGGICIYKKSSWINKEDRKFVQPMLGCGTVDLKVPQQVECHQSSSGIWIYGVYNIPGCAVIGMSTWCAAVPPVCAGVVRAALVKRGPNGHHSYVAGRRVLLTSSGDDSQCWIRYTRFGVKIHCDKPTQGIFTCDGEEMHFNVSTEFHIPYQSCNFGAEGFWQYADQVLTIPWTIKPGWPQYAGFVLKVYEWIVWSGFFGQLVTIVVMLWALRFILVEMRIYRLIKWTCVFVVYWIILMWHRCRGRKQNISDLNSPTGGKTWNVKNKHGISHSGELRFCGRGFQWHWWFWFILVMFWLCGARRANAVSFRSGDPVTSVTKGNATLTVYGIDVKFQCTPVGYYCIEGHVYTDGKIICLSSECPRSNLVCESQYQLIQQKSFGWREHCGLFNENVLCSTASYWCPTDKLIPIYKCVYQNYSVVVNVNNGIKMELGEGVRNMTNATVTVIGHTYDTPSYDAIYKGNKMYKPNNAQRYTKKGCGVGGLMCSVYVSQGGGVQMGCPQPINFSGEEQVEYGMCVHKINGTVVTYVQCPYFGVEVDIDFDIMVSQESTTKFDWTVSDCGCFGDCMCVVIFNCTGTAFYNDKFYQCGSGHMFQSIQKDEQRACVTLNGNEKCDRIMYHEHSGGSYEWHEQDTESMSLMDKLRSKIKEWFGDWWVDTIIVVLLLIVIVFIWKLIWRCIDKKK